MEPSERNILIRIIFAVIGVLVGVSIFLCFGIAFSNWNCALWGLISGVFLLLSIFNLDLTNSWKLEAKVIVYHVILHLFNIYVKPC